MSRGNKEIYKYSKVGDNAYEIDSKDVSNLTRQAILLSSWERVDVDSDSEVEKRINEYFVFCANNGCRPAVSGLALALGIDRVTLNDWKCGRSRANSNRANIIKKAYSVLEYLWESYMQEGKINPASGCFLGKNNFDYHDESKVTIEAVNTLQANKTPEQIASEIPVDTE